MTVTIHVEGIPGPKGSKNVSRWGNTYESSKRVKPWEEAVHAAAVRAGDDAYLLGPLTPPYKVEVWFYFRKPRTNRTDVPTGQNLGDLDKFVRCTLDPLTTSGLIIDDRYVTELTATKQWAGRNETPGAIIRITELG